MNATVIVFMPARDAQSLTEPTAPLRVVDLWQHGTESDNIRAGFQQTSGDQPALPFWTWFIANPRRCSA